ncbi:hypothetical protein Tco_0217626 [Tanacetum coccineum]
MLAPSGGGLILHQAYGNLYAVTADLLEDKQISSVGVFDEVFSTWMAFGGNTRDLGSFGEETDEITDLHQILEEVLLKERGDSVAIIKRLHRDIFSDGYNGESNKRSTTLSSENNDALRDTITALIKEEMEKIREEIRNEASTSTAGQIGTMARQQGGNQRGLNNMQYSRVTKIKFLRVGGEDVRGWLFKCEQFFKVDGIAEDQRQVILQKFGLAYDDPLAEIKKIKHVKTVQDYIDDYDKLLLAVRMFKPRSLAELYGLAKLQETNLNDMKSKNKRPLFPNPRFSGYNSTYLNSLKPGEELVADMMILPLGGCEMVLVFNMVFATPTNDAPNGLQTLLTDYDDVFAIPKELPPIRSHNHRIPLKEGSPIVNIRPYRHPATQKDAIEIYNPDMQSHTEHLRLLFHTMRHHQLKSKLSKCVFEASQVEYLGHVFSDKGVATDPTKIQAMKE